MSYLTAARQLRSQKQNAHQRAEELLRILSAEFNKRVDLFELDGLTNDEAVKEAMAEVEKLPAFAEWKALG